MQPITSRHRNLALFGLLALVVGFTSWASAPQEVASAKTPAVADAVNTPASESVVEQVAAQQQSEAAEASSGTARQPQGDALVLPKDSGAVAASGPVIGPAGPVNCNCNLGAPNNFCPNGWTCQSCPCIGSAGQGVCRPAP
ncbi:MAG: hypothetical protein AAF657_17635 [Acidobacteriota bacterium]